MNDKINLKDLEQKTHREFLIDGVTEILLGLILLFIPIFFLNPIFIVFTPFLLFVSPQVLDFIRQRTTYPRIGRVEFKEEGTSDTTSVKKSLLEFLIFLMVVFSLTIVCMLIFEGKILDISSWYSWVPFVFGLIMFGPSLYLVEKTGLRYYYIFGIFSSLLGLRISLLEFPGKFDGMYMYFFILGVLAIIIGLFRYFWFIRNYPRINLEEN